MAGVIKYKVLKEFIFKPGQERNIESVISTFLANDKPSNVIESKISIDEKFTILSFFISDQKQEPPKLQIIFNKTFVLFPGEEKYLEGKINAFLNATLPPHVYRSAICAATWHEERFLIYSLFYIEDTEII